MMTDDIYQLYKKSEIQILKYILPIFFLVHVDLQAYLSSLDQGHIYQF